MEGEEIIFWRRKRGYSQERLAKEIPVCVRQLSLYENNRVKNPSDWVYERIREILDIPKGDK